ncbi:S8 family serine peptidase [Asanoa siamensis]|uniref:Peptidase S8/S53 domain-containing protein n=1 Tax=Asanoa siamensis TaxID=926357 RepID=A0ABQ4CYN0_9ACTN|nr:S8 family serine peptidase [Asanoa siamensis]GIF76396.1 hypothetical protein Asi02nite_59140 [Asanoa siamensis]
MKQFKDRRSRARWLAATTAVLTLATLPLLATPAHADTVRSLSWHLDSLRILRAQQITKGAGVTVAIVDGGVQANNRDLVGQVVPGKGFASDVPGDGRVDPDKDLSHGTAMASLIAGRGGGDQRMLGIAPQAKVMPAAVGTAKATMAEAIRWAADQRIGVINISMEPTTTVFDPGLDDALTHALQRDVVVVASAGNQGGDLGQIARHPGVVSVAAVDRKGKLWEGTARGHQLALSAPGVDMIMSVNTGNGYGVGSGTSAAAAITSGVVALIRSRFPDLDATNVINRLVRTATDQGEKGRDGFYGFGLIDPVRALTAEVPAVDVNPLGATAPLPSESAGAAATGEDADEGSGLGINVNADPGGLLLYGLGCLAVVAAIVALVVWSNRRRRRRLAAYGPGGPVPPGRMPPGGFPGGPPGAAPPGPYAGGLHGAPPPGQWGAPTAPGQVGAPPPGQWGGPTAPGQAGAPPPGQWGGPTAPGQAGALPPGQWGAPTAPGQAGAPPPGQWGAPPPGHRGPMAPPSHGSVPGHAPQPPYPPQPPAYGPPPQSAFGSPPPQPAYGSPPRGGGDGNPPPPVQSTGQGPMSPQADGDAGAGSGAQPAEQRQPPPMGDR